MSTDKYRQQLQLVPEKLEARISEKRFLTAVEVLSEAMRVIKQPELMEIGALQDLRIYLGNQETVGSILMRFLCVTDSILVTGRYFGGGTP